MRVLGAARCDRRRIQDRGRDRCPRSICQVPLLQGVGRIVRCRPSAAVGIGNGRHLHGGRREEPARRPAHDAEVLDVHVPSARVTGVP